MGNATFITCLDLQHRLLGNSLLRLSVSFPLKGESFRTYQLSPLFVAIKKIRPYAHDYSWNDATIVTKINSFQNELFNLKLENTVFSQEKCG